jgi:hypothetical protein
MIGTCEELPTPYALNNTLLGRLKHDLENTAMLQSIRPEGSLPIRRRSSRACPDTAAFDAKLIHLGFGADEQVVTDGRLQ